MYLSMGMMWLMEECQGPDAMKCQMDQEEQCVVDEECGQQFQHKSA